MLRCSALLSYAGSPSCPFQVGAILSLPHAINVTIREMLTSTAVRFYSTIAVLTSLVYH
jgi:hypothetical protein